MENSDNSFQGVIDRLRVASTLPSEQALAERLGLKRSAFTVRKSRGSLPRTEIDAFIAAQGLNSEWVYEGRGTMFAGPGFSEKVRLQAEIDKRLAPFALSKREHSYMARLLMALEMTDPLRLKELLDDASNLSVEEALLVNGFRCAPQELAVAMKHLAASARHLAGRARVAASF